MTELLIKIICALIPSVYYVLRLGKYIDNRKNNNVTGDVLFRWESVSIIDKYHLRERFLPGSRLRIKRDAKRHEIKYYVIGIVQSVIFIVITLKPYGMYTYITGAFNLTIIIKLLFDKIENKGNILGRIVSIIFFALTLATSVFVSAGVPFEKSRLTDFNIGGDKPGFNTVTYAALFVTVIIFLFSIIKKRVLSVIICAGGIAATVLSTGFSDVVNSDCCMIIHFITYMYVSLFIMQSVYNVRALKKITFIG